jgi:Fe-S cluster biogenesis protein NfuA
MSDNDVGLELRRLDKLLGAVESTPGPAGELALDAVSALGRLYGEALARALACVTGFPRLRDAFLRDELLGHLLVLHDIHPEPVETRVARVLTDMADSVREHGGHVELLSVDGDVATVQLSASGCGASAAITDAVRDAIFAIAPELSEVAVISAKQRDPTFIPLAVLGAGRSAPGVTP